MFTILSAKVKQPPFETGVYIYIYPGHLTRPLVIHYKGVITGPQTRFTDHYRAMWQRGMLSLYVHVSAYICMLVILSVLMTCYMSSLLILSVCL